jgi:hypothetical protein
MNTSSINSELSDVPISTEDPVPDIYKIFTLIADHESKSSRILHKIMSESSSSLETLGDKNMNYELTRYLLFEVGVGNSAHFLSLVYSNAMMNLYCYKLTGIRYKAASDHLEIFMGALDLLLLTPKAIVVSYATMCMAVIKTDPKIDSKIKKRLNERKSLTSTASVVGNPRDILEQKASLGHLKYTLTTDEAQGMFESELFIMFDNGDVRTYLASAYNPKDAEKLVLAKYLNE